MNNVLTYVSLKNTPPLPMKGSGVGNSELIKADFITIYTIMLKKIRSAIRVSVSLPFLKNLPNQSSSRFCFASLVPLFFGERRIRPFPR